MLEAGWKNKERKVRLVQQHSYYFIATEKKAFIILTLSKKSAEIQL